MFRLEPKDITVVAASDDGVNGIRHAVKSVVVHPNYGMIPYDYEFACVQLQEPLKFTAKTKKVNITDHAPKDGSWVQTAGWGLTVREKTHLANACTSILPFCLTVFILVGLLVN